jgi:hypothetical protein
MSGLSDRTNEIIAGPSTRIKPEIAAKGKVLIYDLENQYFTGPRSRHGAYASVSILNPAITVERHHGKYYIAASFNTETTILRYSTQKGYVFCERLYFLSYG